MYDEPKNTIQAKTCLFLYCFVPLYEHYNLMTLSCYNYYTINKYADDPIIDFRENYIGLNAGVRLL